MREQPPFGGIHRVFGDAIWNVIIPHCLPHLQYKGLENLNILNQEIAQHGSILLVTNHESHLDFLLIARLIQEHILDPHSFSIIASMKFFDGTINSLTVGIAHYLSAKHHYQLLPVVQNYDTRYLDSQTDINARSSRIVRRELRHGQSIVGLAPTGTRNPNGVATHALRGAGVFARSSTLIAPFAVQDTRKLFSKQNVPNPLARAQLTVGAPITPNALQEKYHATNKDMHHVLMREILQYVDPRYWGAYAPVRS